MLRPFTSQDTRWRYHDATPPEAPFPGKTPGRRECAPAWSGSAMRRRLLIRDAFDRAFLGADGRARQGLDHGARALGIGDPLLVEVIRADRFAAHILAGVDLAGVAAMHQLEEVILRLHVAPRIADQRLRELRILDAHILFAAFAERAAVEADDGGMAEIGVDAVEARGIGDRDIDIVGPGHGLRHQDLLILRGVHVALAAHDELGALHRAVAPDLGIVAVIADDEAHLEPLRALGDIGAIAGIPALDGNPGHDLAVFLHDLALVVHQDERVVGRLLRMLLMPLAGEREHTPDLRLAAGLGEDLGLFAGHGRRGVVHLLLVVHDPVRAVFREDHEIHSGQADLHALQHLGDVAGIVQDLLLGVEPRHLVVDDGHADGVVAAGNIAVKHFDLLLDQPWSGGECDRRASEHRAVHSPLRRSTGSGRRVSSCYGFAARRRRKKPAPSTTVVVAGASLPINYCTAPLPCAQAAGTG